MIVMTGFDRENLYFDIETIKEKEDYVPEFPWQDIVPE